MASRKRKKTSTKDAPPEKRTGKRQIIGIILMAVAILQFMGLLTYNPWDIPTLQSPPNQPILNWIGLIGAWSSYHCFVLLGVASYVVPFIIAAQGLLCIYGEEIRPGMKVIHKFGWMALLLLCLACGMELAQGPGGAMAAKLNIPFAGGAVGHLFGAMTLMTLLGEMGTGIVLGVVVLISAVCLFDFEVTALFRDPKGTLGPILKRLTQWMIPPEDGEEEESFEPELDVEPVKPKKRKPRKPKKPKVEKEPIPDPEPEFRPASQLIPEPEEEVQELLPEPAPPMPEPIPEPEPEPLTIPSPEPAMEDAEPSVFKNPEPEPKPPKPVQVKKAHDWEQADMVMPDHDAEGATNSEGKVWTLPPVELLQAPTGKVESDGTREAYLKQHLETTLKEFGVDARITDVQRGPVVTSFEVLPAAGVRVEKIANLTNNLALALKAETIRVQAPIPGKGVVGIEVPNNKSTVVYARETIESKNWSQAKDWRKGKIALPMLLGVDVSGNQLVGDLADMPHVLIAGATGSGKSVCMNSLLAGLLMSRTPEQLRLILVDPKIVEFTAYKELPHLVVPVITDPKKVGLGLRWAITEMEKRYKLFAKCGVRNIKSFNNRVVAKQGDLFGAEESEDKVPETLPYIVVVIDELADLMMVAQAEIENYIARLAQLSRAVGIHMILATQRPSVNVITGTIKANFPARIAFQVAQKTDSRTILDAIGADKLLGKGDMLYLSPSSSKLTRAQGAWTSDEEINEIVAHYKEQGTPEYENKVTEKLTSTKPDLPEQGEEDELVNQAVEVIRQTRRASTSSLQRRLRIGYNRAARLMDQLEEQGIIGPPQGSEPREILIDLEGEVPQNPPDQEATS